MRFLLVTLSLTLAACTAQQAPRITPTANQLTLIPVTVVSDDARLTNEVVPSLLQYNVLDPMPAGSITSLQLTLRTEPYSPSARAQGPQVFGRLQPQLVVTGAITDYRLTTASGRVLDEGEIIGTGGSEISWQPGQKPELPQAAYEDITEQLIDLITPHIAAQPWQTRLMTMLDNDHGVIAASPRSGLKIGDTLRTVSQPVAEFEVAQFDSINGRPRVILKRKNGLPPASGSPLELVR